MSRRRAVRTFHENAFHGFSDGQGSVPVEILFLSQPKRFLHEPAGAPVQLAEQPSSHLLYAASQVIAPPLPHGRGSAVDSEPRASASGLEAGAGINGAVYIMMAQGRGRGWNCDSDSGNDTLQKAENRGQSPMRLRLSNACGTWHSAASPPNRKSKGKSQKAKGKNL